MQEALLKSHLAQKHAHLQ